MQYCKGGRYRNLHFFPIKSRSRVYGSSQRFSYSSWHYCVCADATQSAGGIPISEVQMMCTPAQYKTRVISRLWTSKLDFFQDAQLTVGLSSARDLTSVSGGELPPRACGQICGHHRERPGECFFLEFRCFLGRKCGARSAWPVISYRKRLAIVCRGLPHLRRVNASEKVSSSWARVIPT